MVTRRLAALVVAAALASAPVAIEACQAVCALQTAASAATPAAEQHSCHHMASAARPGAEMRGVPHDCAHSNDLPTACGTVLQSGLTAPAVVPIVAFNWAPARGAAPAFDASPGISPPRSANPGQLRV
jgi:hypothetical protein